MKDLWSYLASSKKPIVMYGMGNGADKIIAVLEKYGRVVDDFFASDDFVRGQSFHGKKVLSFSQIKEKYGEFIVLVSFGSPRREVLDRVYEMSGAYELYSPDVPLAGEDLFDFEFYTKNLEKINRAREIFANERSKEIYDNIISYKLSGMIGYLQNAVSDKSDDPRDVSGYKTVVDAGAYTGDTARETLESCPEIEKIICLEPDVRNFKKLSAFAEENVKVVAVNAGAWDIDTTVSFGSAGNRNSNAFSGGKEISVSMKKIDGLCEGLFVDSVKYDVEGAEMKALLGSRRTIERCLPDLKVSLYHRSEDIFEIPLYLYENYPQYKFYLTRKECIPAWEIDLIAVKK
ncbi:MAG: FkbM family methyltransferase [Ruminococcaceae bacterium]|nr:FkbM family methyltransferase [Oscillospiraceae bacterium]